MFTDFQDLYQDLIDGFSFFLNNELPNLTSQEINDRAIAFADANTSYILNFKPLDDALFGDDVIEAFGLSVDLRLWLCKLKDRSYKCGFDVGNGWYIPLEINISI